VVCLPPRGMTALCSLSACPADRIHLQLACRCSRCKKPPPHSVALALDATARRGGIDPTRSASSVSSQRASQPPIGHALNTQAALRPRSTQLDQVSCRRRLCCRDLSRRHRRSRDERYMRPELAVTANARRCSSLTRTTTSERARTASRYLVAKKAGLPTELHVLMPPRTRFRHASHSQPRVPGGAWPPPWSNGCARSRCCRRSKTTPAAAPMTQRFANAEALLASIASGASVMLAALAIQIHRGYVPREVVRRSNRSARP